MNRTQAILMAVIGAGSLLSGGSDARGVEPELLEMDEVVVTASRLSDRAADLPTNVSVIGRDEIRRGDAQTAGDVLKGQAGVIDVSDRGSRGSGQDIRIRSGGDSASQVLVLLDGQPLNEAALGSADLSDIPADDIERVEILRGPSSALWGANALGGVVNIVTLEPRGEGMKVGLASDVGSFGGRRYRVHLQDRAMDRWFAVSAGREETQGWRDNSAYRGDDVLFKTGIRLGESDDLTLRVAYRQGRFGLPGMNNTPMWDYDGSRERKAQSPDASQDKKGRYAQAEYRKDAGGVTLSLRAYGDQVERRYESPLSYTDDRSTQASGGGEVRADLPGGWVAGGGGLYDAFRREGLVTFPATLEIREHTLNSYGFAQRSLRTRKAELVLGGRVDRHQVFGGQFDPRASLTIQPGDGWKMSANAGRAFRAPTFEDLYSPSTAWPASGWGPAGDTRGNTDLKPESSWGWDLGIEKRWDRTFLSRLTFYRSLVRDMIAWSEVDPDPAYDRWRPVNIGSAYHQGVEAEVRHDIGPRLSHGLDYTYLDSRGRQDASGPYRVLPYSPRHRMNYRVDVEAGRGFAAGVRTDLVGRVDWEDDYGSTHHLPGYTLVGARVGRHVGPSEIHVSVSNIFDRKYQDREGYPLPGRMLNGGVQLFF